MTNCHQASLPSKRFDEIKATLNGKDIDDVIASITGDMAVLEIAATAIATQDPLRYLTSNGDLPINAKASLAKAAQLKIFLSVLDELRLGKHPITTTTISLTTTHAP